MSYENIDWSDVSDAIATEDGLLVTYRTPKVGVGQTVLVPRVGQSLPPKPWYPQRPPQLPQRSGSPELRSPSQPSPPGSYGQMPNQPFGIAAQCTAFQFALQIIQEALAQLYEMQLAGKLTPTQVTALNNLKGQAATIIYQAEALGCKWNPNIPSVPS